MSIKLKLILLSFFQFFVWGAWLITVGTYWFENKQWSPTEFGAIFSTMGISSLFMPTLMGIVADRWINSERLYGILHIFYGITLFYLTTIVDSISFFWVILIAMVFYMPTISLSNSISYRLIKNNNLDLIKDFPKIRVWGTIGFIVAMWVTNLSRSGQTENQFFIAGVFAIVLGIYSFTLPKCPPENRNVKSKSIVKSLGLEAFSLFKDYRIAMFFIFSIFLGASLQLTNAYGDTFLSSFGKIDEFKDSFVVKYSTIIMSISQISETLFILLIPFFTYRYGLKKVILISMIAWVLRFGLFSIGAPTGIGLIMILMSNIIYGMAFDFFNISGSMFIEQNTNKNIRSSAQGIFMMMTNGIGAIFGSIVSGIIIDIYFKAADGVIKWSSVWLSFAIYALIITILFAFFFKNNNNSNQLEKATN